MASQHPERVAQRLRIERRWNIRTRSRNGSLRRPIRRFEMRDTFDHLVRHTLGQYLGIEPDAILPTQCLREHLDMKTVDIAFVLLRLEDIARAHFPQASTQLVVTVSDVTELFRAVFGARFAGSAAAHVRS
jgi:hypothetical protein